MITLTGVHECFSRWGVFSAILIPSDNSSFRYLQLRDSFPNIYIFSKNLKGN
jgi:hypothetical protein